MKRRSCRLSLLGVVVGSSWFIAVIDWFGSTPTVDALVRDCFPSTTAITPDDDENDDGCYSSLWEVAVAMEAKNPFVVTTYSLCPNTIYSIGDRDPDRPDCFVNGDTALSLRQYSIVQCGTDGVSGNNCTLTGGYNQMITTAGSYNVEQKHGIIVRGITFAQGRGGALFLAAGGDIEFQDCIFRDHVNDGTIKVVFQAFDEDANERRLSLLPQQEQQTSPQELQPLTQHRRQLSTTRTLLQVTFNRCVFASNRYPGGVPVGLRQLGVIHMRTSPGGVLNVTNSLFVSNEFVADHAFDTYLINVVAGNVLNLHGNCFYDNVLEGRGLVHVANSESLGDVRDNTGGATVTTTTTAATILECDFINVNGTDLRDGDPVCLGFDQATCELQNMPVTPLPPPLGEGGGGGSGPLETGTAGTTSAVSGSSSSSPSPSSSVLRMTVVSLLLLLLVAPTTVSLFVPTIVTVTVL